MKQIKMQKKIKQKLYFKGYQTNPHGKQTPIYTTSETHNSPSLPGARKKLK